MVGVWLDPVMAQVMIVFFDEVITIPILDLRF